MYIDRTIRGARANCTKRESVADGKKWGCEGTISPPWARVMGINIFHSGKGVLLTWVTNSRRCFSLRSQSHLDGLFDDVVRSSYLIAYTSAPWGTQGVTDGD